MLLLLLSLLLLERDLDRVLWTAGCFFEELFFFNEEAEEEADDEVDDNEEEPDEFFSCSLRFADFGATRGSSLCLVSSLEVWWSRALTLNQSSQTKLYEILFLWSSMRRKSMNQLYSKKK